jgi:hypothetical protein
MSAMSALPPWNEVRRGDALEEVMQPERAERLIVAYERVKTVAELAVVLCVGGPRWSVATRRVIGVLVSDSLPTLTTNRSASASSWSSARAG